MEPRKEQKHSGFFSSIYQNINSYFSDEKSTSNKINIDKINIDKPTQILANPNDIVKGKSWPYDVYFIKISPDSEDIPETISPDNVVKVRIDNVKKLLSALNEDKHSRSALEALNYFTSGNFIMSRADEHAQAHHNLFVKCLKNHDFYIQSIIESLRDAINSNQYTNLKDLIAIPLRDMLAKGFFEIDKIPPELNRAISAFASIADDATDNFATNVQLNTLSSELLPTWSLAASGEFRHVKKHYKESTKEFLFNQKEAVFKSIQSFAEGKACQNLIALTIIQLILEEYPDYKIDKDQFSFALKTMSQHHLDKYLMRPEIISIPASITASINLVIIFTCSLLALNFNPELKEALTKEIKEAGFEALIQDNNFKGLRELFDQNAKQNGVLHRIYLESCRRENLLKTSDHLSLETLQTRYTKNPINIHNHEVIPANSIIMILPGTIRFNSSLWSNPESFDIKRFENPSLSKYPLSIFSQGSRECPAKYVSSYLFKSMLCYLTLCCDLTLKIGQDRNINNIEVECIHKIPEKINFIKLT